MPGVTSATQTHLDVALSNFSLEYRQAALFAEKVAPRVLVAKQSNKFWEYGQEDLQAPGNIQRAPTAEANKITRSHSTQSYFCSDHSLSELIADEERGNSEIEDPEQESVEVITNKILLGQEIDFATIIANTSLVTQNTTLSGTAQWNDAATVGNPLKDVQDGHLAIKKNAGVKPNTLIIGAEVFAHLRVNAKVTDAFKYTNFGLVSEDMLKALFEVENLYVASAIQKTTAGVASFVLGKHAVLAYVEPNAGWRSMSFMKTFLWTGAPGTVSGVGVEIGRACDQSRKSDIVTVHKYYDMRIVSAKAGYLIKNCIA